MKMRKLAILFLIVIFAGCKAKLSELPQELDFANEPDLLMENMRLWYKLNSKLKAEAFTPVLKKYENRDIMEFPKGVKVDFYDENLNKITSLRADYAINQPSKKLWKFSGNVFIQRADGTYLKTQELFFDENTKKIYSAKYVEVGDNSGSVIRGKNGFKSDIEFKHYSFANVDGIIKNFQGLR